MDPAKTYLDPSLINTLKTLIHSSKIFRAGFQHQFKCQASLVELEIYARMQCFVTFHVLHAVCVTCYVLHAMCCNMQFVST